jgi:hypothetical protein
MIVDAQNTDFLVPIHKFPHFPMIRAANERFKLEPLTVTPRGVFQTPPFPATKTAPVAKT